MQSKAIRFAAPGGPDVLKLETVDIGAPGPGQALVRQSVAGLNYIDVYHRNGAYPMPYPAGCGSEGAGVVEAVGPDVTTCKPGDRVAYAGGPPGSYAELRLVPAHILVAIPEGVTDEQAAASMLKGMTTEYLLDRCATLKPGDHALMYAAAGGVGLFAGQWAKARGIHLIGVAAGPEKCAAAKAHGYAEVIDRRTTPDIAAKVREITSGKGVPVVFDSVGRDTFDTTLACLAPRGLFVSFGATTGKPPPVEAGVLQAKGSLYFTRPTLATYCAARDDIVASAGALFALMAKGAVVPQIGRRYPLAEAAEAHRDLEAGRTSGSTILTV